MNETPRHSTAPDAVSQTAIDPEIDLDSIRPLDKQIEEHERAIIRLKRTRNSLLNVSTLLPPEILGGIFHWNVIPPDGDFGELSKNSYDSSSFDIAGLSSHRISRSFGASGTTRYKIGTNIIPVVGMFHLIWCLTKGAARVTISMTAYVTRSAGGRAARNTIRRVHLKNCDASQRGGNAAEQGGVVHSTEPGVGSHRGTC